MRVEDVEGSFKLNQQKSEADYAAVANGACCSVRTQARKRSRKLMRDAAAAGLLQVNKPTANRFA